MREDSGSSPLDPLMATDNQETIPVKLDLQRIFALPDVFLRG
jgi:hypothetical protein